MTDTARLKDAIGQSGLKLSYIADKLGISGYCLQLKINNKSEFKSTEILNLCNILGIKSLKTREAIFFVQKVDEMSTEEE